MSIEENFMEDECRHIETMYEQAMEGMGYKDPQQSQSDDEIINEVRALTPALHREPLTVRLYVVGFYGQYNGVTALQHFTSLEHARIYMDLMKVRSAEDERTSRHSVYEDGKFYIEEFETSGIEHIQQQYEEILELNKKPSKRGRVKPIHDDSPDYDVICESDDVIIDPICARCRHLESAHSEELFCPGPLATPTIPKLLIF